MPEGTLCNKKTVDTKEYLDALLADKSGKKYYEEMKHLDVDTGEAARTPWRPAMKSRMRTWLELCSHCALCADTCFLYLANQPGPDPGAVVQDSVHPGEDRQAERRRGQRPHALLHGRGLVQVHLLQPLRHLLPLRHRHGRHVRLPAGPVFLAGLRALGAEDRLGHAPHLPGPDGRDLRGLGGDLRVDGRRAAGRVARPGDPGGQGGRRPDVHLERPGAQALSRGYRRGRHPLPHGRRELDGAQRGLGTDQPVDVRRGLGRLQDDGGERLRGHGAPQAQAGGGHGMRPRPPGHGHRGALLGGPPGRPAAGGLPALHRVGGRGPAHRQDQDRPGQDASRSW